MRCGQGNTFNTAFLLQEMANFSKLYDISFPDPTNTETAYSTIIILKLFDPIRIRTSLIVKADMSFSG